MAALLFVFRCDQTPTALSYRKFFVIHLKIIRHHRQKQHVIQVIHYEDFLS